MDCHSIRGALNGWRAETIKRARSVADFGPMAEMLPGLPVDDEDAAMELWFDHLVREIEACSDNGLFKCYRALNVASVSAFLQSVDAGEPLGVHWTLGEECATSTYHDSRVLETEVLLFGETAFDAIDWPETLLRNYSHPYERELHIVGDVTLYSVEWGSKSTMIATALPTRAQMVEAAAL